MRASSVIGFAFVYFTIQYCVECSNTVSFFLAQNGLYIAQWRYSWCYCTFQGTIRLKMFSFLRVCLLNVLAV